MKYNSGTQFLEAESKCVLLMGLSGVGKTTASRLLPGDEWFHYNVDYRIWTHYLGDELNDFLKKLALENPTLKDLLSKDSISIEHRVHFDNLYATSVFMGMLGKPETGGSTAAEFVERMLQYEHAEIGAMLDIPKFKKRATNLYGYPHFLVDASGSLCEITNPDESDDVQQLLEQECVIVYIESTPEHEAELLRRYIQDPKPIYYRPDFIQQEIPELVKKFKVDKPREIDAKEVGGYLYPKLMSERIPRYKKLADTYGYTISMTDVLECRSADQILQLIADAIDQES